MRTVNPRFMTEPAPFWQVSPDGFRDLFETNVVGYFLVAQTDQRIVAREFAARPPA